jgi:predicted nucleic acid-binding protein
MRVLIDTNVLIDVALEREDFVEDSEAVLDWCSTKGTLAWVAWHTVTNCYYILRSMPPKGLGDEAARLFLSELLEWADIAPATTGIAKSGLGMSGGDLEDHLQALCAEAVSADLIVTRNTADFDNSPVRAISPAQFLKEVATV